MTLAVNERMKKNLITLKIKQEIIKKFENGAKRVELAREYGIPYSNIYTVVKHKEEIKKLKVCDENTIINKSRSLVPEVEKLLLIWIKDRQLRGEHLSMALTCRKAKTIYEDLKKSYEEDSTEDVIEDFKATIGWLCKFKERMGIKDDELREVDKTASEEFKSKFKELIDKENYLPQQVFNVDEMGLFWKKIPEMLDTFPGHEPMKEKLTLLLGSNASGDFKLKPLVVHHSDNPCLLKRHLGVYWRSNENGLITRSIFRDWVFDVLCPSIKEYLIMNNLPLKALLLLDKAPCHDPNLCEFMECKFKFMKVKFLPPNVAPIFQPIDQWVKSDFIKLYIKHVLKSCNKIRYMKKINLHIFLESHFIISFAVRNIVRAWRDITMKSLNSSWHSLWPDIVHDFERVLETKGEVIKEIVRIGDDIGLELSCYYINQIVKQHRDLTTEDLKELEKVFNFDKDVGNNEAIQALNIKKLINEHHSDFINEDLQEIDKVVTFEKDSEINGEVQVLNHLTADDLKKVLDSWKIIKHYAVKHPEIEGTEFLTSQYEDQVIRYFSSLQKEREKQNFKINHICTLPEPVIKNETFEECNIEDKVCVDDQINIKQEDFGVEDKICVDDQINIKEEVIQYNHDEEQNIGDKIGILDGIDIKQEVTRYDREEEENIGDTIFMDPEINIKEEETQYSHDEESRQHRSTYTASFKLKVVKYAKKHGNRAAASHFEEPPTECTIREWRKQERKIKNLPRTKCNFRRGIVKWSELEKELEMWVLDKKRSGIGLSKKTIIVQAVKISQDLQMKNFKATTLWYHRFMKRHRLGTHENKNQVYPKTT